MWIPIIIELVKWLGPILYKWLVEWLAKRMEEAAMRLPDPGTFGSVRESRIALLEEVYESTSWVNFVKKRFAGKVLETMQSRGDELTPATETEVAAMNAIAA